MQKNPTYKSIQDEFESVLLSHVPNEHKPLFEASRYMLKNGGKRIRPLLVLITCYDLNQGKIDHAFDAAAAIEFVHNYSLIHDDLPCMDDDDLRRGRPTLHKVYGEAMAVLTGDFLLSHAFTALLDSKKLGDTLKVKLGQNLSHYCGGGQLLEGQVLDLAMEGKIGHFYDLMNIYLRKTSSLFCCALEFGAILAGKYQECEMLLKEVGQKLGLAFQVRNDFQGKQKDIEGEKFTIFSLQTEQQAKKLIEKNVTDALQLLDQSPFEFAQLKEMIKTFFLYEV